MQCLFTLCSQGLAHSRCSVNIGKKDCRGAPRDLGINNSYPPNCKIQEKRKGRGRGDSATDPREMVWVCKMREVGGAKREF